jgi:hypothetical protein
MKSAGVITMKAAASVTTMSATPAVSATAMSALSQCRGRRSKCHCQTGSAYRSVFHNCLLHYG